MKQGKTLQDFAAEIQRQNDPNVKRDFIVGADAWEMIANNKGAATSNEPLISLNAPANIVMPGNSIFHAKVAQHYKIPKIYYDTMYSGNHAELLAANVNYWRKTKKDAPRMFRTLDGTVRAFLSNKYRRLDNYQIAMIILERIADMRMNVRSCEVTERRMYIKATFPDVRVAVKVGEEIESGFVAKNSEVGLGSLAFFPWTMNLACTNGMAHEQLGQRKAHLGRVVESDEDEAQEIWQDDTLEADDALLMKKIRDVMNAVTNERMFKKLCESMKKADEVPLLPNKTDNVAEMLSAAGKRFGISEGEQQNVLKHLIEGGNLSFWGLANAVTRTAEDMDSYDRASELEAVGWDIVNSVAPVDKREVVFA